MFEIFGTTQASSGQTERVLTYVKNERMGGFVPKYEIRQKGEQDEAQDIGQNIQSAIVGSQGQDLLAFQSPQNNTQPEDQFGFSDMLDMVNPLHHIPVVGHVYRELSGDEIRPISRMVGGAAFGGPIGVASALIDTIIQQETGNDMASNAVNFAFNRSEEKLPSPQTPANASPEQSIENAIASTHDPDMTSTLLAFSDLGAKDEALLKFEARQRAEQSMKEAIEREEITRVSFASDSGSGLYGL